MKTSDQRSASQGAAKTLRRPACRQSKGMSADRGLKSEGEKKTLGFLIQIRTGLGCYNGSGLIQKSHRLHFLFL